MNIANVIDRIVQSQFDPGVLDRLHVPYDRPRAGPAAKFGLGCELYLPNSDRAALREQTRQFLLDYHQMFSTLVVEFLPRDARRTVKIGGDLNTRIFADYEKNPEIDGGYSTALFGPVDIGLPKEDIPPYQAQALVSRESEVDLSFVSAFMPVCDDSTKPQFGLLLEAVLRWSEIFKPVHGSAGFSLIYASGMSQNTKYSYSLMKRFPGFDYIDGVEFSLEARAVHNRIKCANWLTILGEEIVAELGGIESMQQALNPQCMVHAYPGGVVIQAGGAPQLGDSYRDDLPQAYRMVARYTKPVRFEDYRSGLFRAPEGLDWKEEALAWIRRFD